MAERGEYRQCRVRPGQLHVHHQRHVTRRKDQRPEQQAARPVRGEQAPVPAGCRRVGAEDHERRVDVQLGLQLGHVQLPGSLFREVPATLDLQHGRQQRPVHRIAEQHDAVGVVGARDHDADVGGLGASVVVIGHFDVEHGGQQPGHQVRVELGQGDRGFVFGRGHGSTVCTGSAYTGPCPY